MFWFEPERPKVDGECGRFGAVPGLPPCEDDWVVGGFYRLVWRFCFYDRLNRAVSFAW